jgi:ribulose-5-phosphate 4-epimerase/fuculose-1-phosphate aldolase
MAHDHLKLRKTLLDACRILDREGLVHAYGHVSARAPDRASVLISPRKGPRLVKSPAEILRITMSGAAYPVAGKGRKDNRRSRKLEAPLEVFAHTEVYRLRPDVNAVCRVHGKFSLVMSVLGRALRPVHELATALGREVPVFDTPELISSPEIGHRMATALGAGHALLLRGNGQITTGASIEEAVVNAILLEVSAEVQWRALCVGQPVCIEGEEYAKVAKRQYEWIQRPWAYYLSRANSRS